MKVTRFRPAAASQSNFLKGRRIVLRPLVTEDFGQWSEVRSVNKEWLTTTDVAEYLNLSRAALYRVIKSDEDFPKGYSILKTKRLWKKKELDDWVSTKSEE